MLTDPTALGPNTRKLGAVRVQYGIHSCQTMMDYYLGSSRIFMIPRFLGHKVTKKSG